MSLLSLAPLFSIAPLADTANSAAATLSAAANAATSAGATANAATSAAANAAVAATAQGNTAGWTPALIILVPALIGIAYALDHVFKGVLYQASTKLGRIDPTSLLLALFAAASPLLWPAALYLQSFGFFDTLPMCHECIYLPVTNGAAVGSGFLGLSYELTFDGRSLLLLFLTGIIAPFALIISRHVNRPILFVALFLLMESAAAGVFMAQNFFLWFLFWELSLVPAFFLIKLWGGAGASRAAFQFVLYTVGGSAFLLAAFGALYAATGTWDFRALAAADTAGALAQQFGTAAPTLVFLGALLGFAVKVPLWPFHTWLPDAYTEAPIGVSMFLTAIMSKMGLFGFFAILAPIFPDALAAASRWLLWLAVAGVVLGAWAALRQTDLKRMVAYSSVNHLSYCLLALFAAQFATKGAAGDAASVTSALNGAWLQMFNHGLSAAALFFCVGLLERQTGSRSISDFGGLRKQAPLFALLCGIAMFSSLGLPGLNGFAGEFLIFRGVFNLAPWAAGISTLGLLATAIFLLTFWQKTFHGPVAGKTEQFTDSKCAVDIFALAPIAALMLLFGVWPQLLLGLFTK